MSQRVLLEVSDYLPLVIFLVWVFVGCCVLTFARWVGVLWVLLEGWRV